MPAALIEVDEVICGNDVDPIVVNFESGEKSKDLCLNLKCDVYESPRQKRILAACTDSMFCMSDLNSSESLLHNFLILKNRQNNKVRLVNLNQAFLRPYIETSNKILDSSFTGEKITNAELNKQFGSKRVKRNTEQKERLKLDIENVKEQLEETVSTIKTNDFLNSSENMSNQSSYVPPINRNASTADQVYDLDKLIPQNILNALETEVDSLLKTADVKKLKLFNSCTKVVQCAMENPSLRKNLQRCKIYLYINYLLTFLAVPAKNLSRKFVLCESSQELNSQILNAFTISTGGNRTRPMSMRDKTICYILVLAIVASDYSIDLELFAKDIKIGLKKLQQMSRILGFTMNGPKMAELKLPLPPPVVSNYTPKKK